MYTVQFEEVVYMLHAFQKKSKAGIKTPKQETDLVEKRLKKAHELYQERLRAKEKR
jgi:phage-related protein